MELMDNGMDQVVGRDGKRLVYFRCVYSCLHTVRCFVVFSSFWHKQRHCLQSDACVPDDPSSLDAVAGREGRRPAFFRLLTLCHQYR